MSITQGTICILTSVEARGAEVKLCGLTSKLTGPLWCDGIWARLFGPNDGTPQWVRLNDELGQIPKRVGGGGWDKPPAKQVAIVFEPGSAGRFVGEMMKNMTLIEWLIVAAIVFILIAVFVGFGNNRTYANHIVEIRAHFPG